MAKRFLVDIDLARNQIQNSVFQVLPSSPSVPIPGQFYYNSTTGRFEYRGNTAWIDPTDRQFHSGTQLANTISNFDTQVRTSRLDQMTAPNSNLSLNNQRLVDVATPVNANDAANKGYVDSLVNGTDWKQSVRVATTTSITLSNAQVIDGVSVVVGNRVLVKNQTTASQNGIYVVALGTWSRATDADENSEVTSGLAVMVEEGVINDNTQWVLITNNPITIGTTSLVFAQLGAGSSFTQGNGISISGNVISTDTAVVTRKFAQTVGNGSASSISVSHNLGTLDVQVQVYEVSTGETIECDINRTNTNQVTLAFAVTPANNSLRVVVQG